MYSTCGLLKGYHFMWSIANIIVPKASSLKCMVITLHFDLFLFLDFTVLHVLLCILTLKLWAPFKGWQCGTQVG